MTKSDNPLDLLLRRLSTYAPLDETDRRAICDLPCTVRTIEPSGYVIREGDAPKLTGVLVSGFAFRQKHAGDGSRQIMSLQIPGDPLDFQNMFLDESDHSVQTLTRADVAFIPRTKLQELMAVRPAVGRAMFLITLVEASIFREWILNLGRRPAKARIAHVLCELAVRLEMQGLSDHYGYHLPMTQEQLADVTGLTAVHVNRTLKALESAGLIKREKRRISFPDWQGLREVGDFNQRYLHTHVQHAAAPPADFSGTNLS